MQRRSCKQYIVRSYNTSTFSAVRFDENPFTYQCEKEDKKAKGFQISLFYWSFSNNIMAVKGLKTTNESAKSETLKPFCLLFCTGM